MASKISLFIHAGSDPLEKHMPRNASTALPTTLCLSPVNTRRGSSVGEMLSSTLDQYHANTGSTCSARWVNVDIKTSILKPIHARWLIAAIELTTQNTGCIIKGFVHAGLK